MWLATAAGEEAGHQPVGVKHAAVIIMWESDLHKIIFTRDLVGAILARVSPCKLIWCVIGLFWLLGGRRKGKEYEIDHIVGGVARLKVLANNYKSHIFYSCIEKNQQQTSHILVCQT